MWLQIFSIELLDDVGVDGVDRKFPKFRAIPSSMVLQEKTIYLVRYSIMLAHSGRVKQADKKLVRNQKSINGLVLFELIAAMGANVIVIIIAAAAFDCAAAFWTFEIS
jgi:hypothetical protein